MTLYLGNDVIASGLTAAVLNGKADVDLSNCTKPHIVETYVNGTSWYRIYSDGWCEQGGTLTPTNNFSYVLNFLVSFKDTNYYIGKSYGGTYTGNCLCSYISFSSKTTSSVVTFNGGTGDEYMWHACGYIS